MDAQIDGTDAARGTSAKPLVRLTRSIEESSALDAAVGALRPVAGLLTDPPAMRALLTGSWLGHAAHPPLTDLPVGLWTSAGVLDLVGAERSRQAAQRLVGLGILSAVPTALTGLAEFRLLSDQTDRRTGVVHAAGNSVALLAYVGSWLARRGGRHRLGVTLGMVGAAVSGGSAYLGGHLAQNASFED
ncbi:MAG TPA: DUF2231 domain-containing protein [Marmoricola sp.]|nr:DUF2231 domain-containing protein [Marmoricola sp.]